LFNPYVNLPSQVLINFFFFFIFIIIIINSIIGTITITITIISITTTTTNIIIIIVVVVVVVVVITIVVVTIVVVLLLLIIYTINLPVVRPRFCRVIYYFDTPALGRRHQSFGRVKYPLKWGMKNQRGLESDMYQGK
jgi:hypothetical protein